MEVESYRLFVSLPVPANVRKAINEFARALDMQIPAEAVRWTPTEQIHLTLKFLGKVDSTAVPEVEEALKAATRGAAGFELQMADLGAFPSHRDPRVIWIGLAGDLDALLWLQTRVSDALGQWCEKEESRTFKPHLTVGRVRDPQSGNQKKIAAALKSAHAPDAQPWRAEHVSLMRSQLSPHGARHTAIGEFPL